MDPRLQDWLIGLVERGLRFARLALYGAVSVWVVIGVDGIMEEPWRAALGAGLVGFLYAIEPKGLVQFQPPQPPPPLRPGG